MFRMFNQAFAAITILFAALESFAMALFHLSKWSEDAAGTFADEQRVEREAKGLALSSKLEEQKAALLANAGKPSAKAGAKAAATPATQP